MIKAPDKLIARRADTKARADFATWKMLAKLNGSSSLSAEAQRFLVRYKTFLNDMPESEAGEATIELMYKTYYAEMGGVGTPPEVRPEPKDQVTDNVTAFKRPAPRPKPAASGPQARPRLPVALIFCCLIVVYVGVRYFWR